jgi:hypothetical protein
MKTITDVQLADGTWVPFEEGIDLVECKAMMTKEMLTSEEAEKKYGIKTH